MVRELNSLGLSIEPRGAVVTKVDESSEVEGVELAKAAGAELIASEAEIIAEKGPMEIEEAVV